MSGSTRPNPTMSGSTRPNPTMSGSTRPNPTQLGLGGLGRLRVGLATNEYSDLEPEEFNSIMNGFKAPNRTDVQVDGQSETISSAATSYSPPPMDWRWLGFVTPVKNQGSCGSCWSFSATGAMEGMHKRRTDVLPNLSEQNLIDCSSDYGNLGCKGGYMINAFNYVIRNRGINTQASYPYRGEQDFCQYRSDTNAVTGMTGYVRVTQGDEIALEDAVRRIGPIWDGFEWELILDCEELLGNLVG
ncbi:Cathepsin L [Folsomia candida]|uniref:Cathepsin L n=1 Tax=Folsomia candida TaxID=158441 RepID=A0A226DM79_FOLCA|nr:Cathepsin L [Folsomia candida]